MQRGFFPEIVEQHAEEAAFLWVLRNEATRAPNYDLASLAELDERIDAHLDGLRVAGAAGWDECRRQLAWRERGEVFAAGCIALQSRIGRRLDIVLEVAGDSVERSRGLIGALAWLPYEEVAASLTAYCQSQEPIVRRIGLGAAAAHRRDPGRVLEEAIHSSHPALRARAVRAAAQLGRRDLLDLITAAATEDTNEVQFWRAWSALLLGDTGCLGPLWTMALAGGPYAEAACDVAARRMKPNDARTMQRELARMNNGTRRAIVVSAALGDPALVPWLIEQMEHEPHARKAGEAFTTITGVELPGAGLAAMRPEEFEAGPNDDPNDDDVAIDPDEHLPWPRPRVVAQWWAKRQHEFASGSRYLAGMPISASALREILLRGRQRQRKAAAVELLLLQPDQPLFEVCARADVQFGRLTQASVHSHSQ
jgi:uncharacterized protein (TIGR02270 family)